MAATATTNVWATKAAMPTARDGLTVGVVNGIVYVIGGSGSGGNLTKVEAYTPGSNTWTAKASLPQGRSALNGSGTINGVLYVAGGLSSNGATTTTYAYNPSTNTWATKAPSA
ncbi:MAG TPA: kelch repeat-containing protein [Gemmatimonadales bacterium]|jgi:N-acetylneuraminic acid mutarotase|nr:kelch repeat-containing protein [Gemmatimonadales bacterium]